MGVPPSKSKRFRLSALLRRIWPAKKPDIDNFLKVAMDALNKHAYADDAQIVECSARKLFHETPALVITLGRMIQEQDEDDDAHSGRVRALP